MQGKGDAHCLVKYISEQSRNLIVRSVRVLQKPDFALKQFHTKQVRDLSSPADNVITKDFLVTVQFVQRLLIWHFCPLVVLPREFPKYAPRFCLSVKIVLGIELRDLRRTPR